MVGLPYPYPTHLLLGFSVEQWSQIATIVSVFGLGVLGAIVPLMKHIKAWRSKKSMIKQEERREEVKEMIKESTIPIIQSLEEIKKGQEHNSKAIQNTLGSTREMIKQFNAFKKEDFNPTKDKVNSIQTEAEFLKKIVTGSLALKDREEP